MVSVGIIGLGAYVPPHEMSNQDWEEIVETSDEWITTKTGKVSSYLESVLSSSSSEVGGTETLSFPAS